jgi:hypothetical protein
MAKRIIVLERTDGAPVSFRVAFWLTVAAARQSYYARVGLVSVWPGASAGENTALAAGQVVEVVDTHEIPPGASLAVIEAELEAIWTAKQAAFTASNIPNRYGSFWDSVGGWTLVNN